MEYAMYQELIQEIKIANIQRNKIIEQNNQIIELIKPEKNKTGITNKTEK